ncbi:MAG: HNH endonuclease [Thermoplasmataceae archaeon]
MNRIKRYPSESIFKNIPGISPGTVRIVSDRFKIAKVSDFDPDGDRTGKSITWATISGAVLLRDNYTCRICEKSSFTSVGSATEFEQVHLDVQVHHIIPRKDGGRDNFKNLITLCESCHHKTFRGGYGGIPVEKQLNLFSFEQDLVLCLPQGFVPSQDHLKVSVYIQDYSMVHNQLRDRWELAYLQGSKLSVNAVSIKKSVYHNLLDDLQLVKEISDYVTMHASINGKKGKIRVFITERGEPVL